MTRRFLAAFFLALFPSIAGAAEGSIQFNAGSLRVALSATGQVQSLYDVMGKREYLAAGPFRS